MFPKSGVFFALFAAFVMAEGKLNGFNKPLEVCSLDPKTGWLRSGKCQTDANDYGTHVMCCEMTDEVTSLFSWRM